MKILFVTPQLPSPTGQGAAIRNYHLARAVGQQHEVHLLSFAPDTTADLSHLSPFCQRVELIPPPPPRRLVRRALETVAIGEPDLARRLLSPAMFLALRALVDREQYRLVQGEGLELGPYLLDLHRSRRRPPLLVYDGHNAEFALQRSIFLANLQELRSCHTAAYSLVQWVKLARYEREVCRSCDVVLAVSGEERARLLGLKIENPIGVVANGVDTRYFQYADPSNWRRPWVLFVGNMGYRPNADAVRWFARAVLPLVRLRHTGIRFFVVGGSPAPIRLPPVRDRGAVVITGWVPDVRAYLSRSSVFVAPVRMGGGSRLKVLEAMAAGTPVASSPLGLEGISGAPGRHCLVAEGAEEFTQAVVRLLDNRPLASELALEARALVEQNYDWSLVGNSLLETYAALGTG